MNNEDKEGPLELQVGTDVTSAPTPDVRNQRLVLHLLVPVMSKERFAEHVGLAPGVIQGMIEKGHLPSKKIGRHRLVNLVVLTDICR